MFQGALQCLSASQAPGRFDAPLVHVQGDRSEARLREADQALGVGRPQELAHFDGFWRCHSSCAAGQRHVRERAEDVSVPRVADCQGEAELHVIAKEMCRVGMGTQYSLTKVVPGTLDDSVGDAVDGCKGNAGSLEASSLLHVTHCDGRTSAELLCSARTGIPCSMFRLRACETWWSQLVDGLGFMVPVTVDPCPRKARRR